MATSCCVRRIAHSISIPAPLRRMVMVSPISSVHQKSSSLIRRFDSSSYLQKDLHTIKQRDYNEASVILTNPRDICQISKKFYQTDLPKRADDNNGTGGSIDSGTPAESISGESPDADPSYSDNLWLRELSNQTENADKLQAPGKDPHHIAHVNATYNNTIVTVTDCDGDTLNWASSGTVGFTGARRSTQFAAQTAGQKVAEVALEKGVSAVRVKIKGIGPGRTTAVKGLQLGGLSIISISDVTPVPHNGCRPKKARRL